MSKKQDKQESEAASMEYTLLKMGVRVLTAASIKYLNREKRILSWEITIPKDDMEECVELCIRISKNADEIIETICTAMCQYGRSMQSREMQRIYQEHNDFVKDRMQHLWEEEQKRIQMMQVLTSCNDGKPDYAITTYIRNQESLEKGFEDEVDLGKYWDSRKRITSDFTITSTNPKVVVPEVVQRKMKTLRNEAMKRIPAFKVPTLDDSTNPGTVTFVNIRGQETTLPSSQSKLEMAESTSTYLMEAYGDRPGIEGIARNVHLTITSDPGVWVKGLPKVTRKAIHLATAAPASNHGQGKFSGEKGVQGNHPESRASKKALMQELKAEAAIDESRQEVKDLKKEKSKASEDWAAWCEIPKREDEQIGQEAKEKVIELDQHIPSFKAPKPEKPKLSSPKLEEEKPVTAERGGEQSLPAQKKEEKRQVAAEREEQPVASQRREEQQVATEREEQPVASQRREERPATAKEVTQAIEDNQSEQHRLKINLVVLDRDNHKGQNERDTEKAACDKALEALQVEERLLKAKRQVLYEREETKKDSVSFSESYPTNVVHSGTYHSSRRGRGNNRK